MPRFPNMNHSCTRSEHLNTRNTGGRAPVEHTPYVIGVCTGGARAGGPADSGQMELHECSVNVAERIGRLLADVDRLKRASEITRPTKFNAAGQAHANRIAQQDRNPQ